MPVNRDSMNEVGEGLRAERGGAYILETLYDKAIAEGGDAIIESIRTVGEVGAMRKKGMKLLALDADPKTRYERAIARGTETDKISFEKFIADEERESTGNDPARMNLRHCIQMADFVIENKGTLEELYEKVEAILAKMAN